MKKMKSAFVVVLSLALVFVLGASAFAAGQPSYSVVGEVKDNELTLTVSIENADAVVGRFAIDYDQTKLTLMGDLSNVGAVVKSSNIDLSAEGLPVEQRISQSEGYVAFAWIAKALTVDATAGTVAIATMKFALKPNVTAADLDWDTAKILQIGSVDLPWETAASLMNRTDKKNYMYNVDGMPECGINFVYPNSTVRPVGAREIRLTLKNMQGQTLQGQVVLDGRKLKANADGSVNTYLSDGNHSVSASMTGYGTLTDTLVVSGADITKDIVLLTDAQTAQAVADDLAIIYVKGDSAKRVTDAIGLVTTGKNGTTVSWETSDPACVSIYGGVSRSTQDKSVTLTATVHKGTESAKKTFSVTVLAEQTPSDPTGGGGKKGFTDLGDVPWAEDAINALYAAGIVNGTSSTTYLPSGQISRGDFVALLMRMLKPTGTVGDNFSDVPKESYYYKEIALAKAVGIAQGGGGNTFNPLAPISRQDMMTLTCRALVLQGKTADKAADLSVLAKFADQSKIADYARGQVARMVEEGFITGSDQGINPLGNATRAETAVFLHRIYTKR